MTLEEVFEGSVEGRFWVDEVLAGADPQIYSLLSSYGSVSPERSETWAGTKSNLFSDPSYWRPRMEAFHVRPQNRTAANG